MKSTPSAKVRNKKDRRSREGAWIEIEEGTEAGTEAGSRSREGAWIEMTTMVLMA